MLNLRYKLLVETRSETPSQLRIFESDVTVFSESARIFVPIPKEMMDAALLETHDAWNSTREYIRRNPPRNYRRDIPDFESIIGELRDENLTE